MSIQAITCAMALRGVTPSEKLLLLALANYADEHMRCYPSQRRLAEDTCLSDRTIRSLLASMEAKQMISRQERVRADKSRSTDVITLHFSGEVQTAQISGGAEIISGGVGKPLPGGAEMVSGLTTFEPSLEPCGLGLGASDWPQGDLVLELVTAAESPWLDHQKSHGLIMTAGIIGSWKASGAGWHRDVLPVVIGLCRNRREAVTSWKFFTNAVLRAIAENSAIHTPPEPNVRPDRNQRPTPREDRLGRMLAGAMAIVDE